jgi:hypothetical protein
MSPLNVERLSFEMKRTWTPQRRMRLFWPGFRSGRKQSAVCCCDEGKGEANRVCWSVNGTVLKALKLNGNQMPSCDGLFWEMNEWTAFVISRNDYNTTRVIDRKYLGWMTLQRSGNRNFRERQRSICCKLELLYVLLINICFSYILFRFVGKFPRYFPAKSSNALSIVKGKNGQNRVHYFTRVRDDTTSLRFPRRLLKSFSPGRDKFVEQVRRCRLPISLWQWLRRIRSRRLSWHRLRRLTNQNHQAMTTGRTISATLVIGPISNGAKHMNSLLFHFKLSSGAGSESECQHRKALGSILWVCFHKLTLRGMAGRIAQLFRERISSQREVSGSSAVPSPVSRNAFCRAHTLSRSAQTSWKPIQKSNLSSG